MAKQTKTTTTTLEMVPASSIAAGGAGGATALFQNASTVRLPARAQKLTLPPLIKPDLIPVGSLLSGVIIAVVASISPREDMRGSKLLHMKHEYGTEFLLPLTGTIKKAVGGFDGAEKSVGKTLFVVRQPDGETTKYSGKGEPAKKVYMFDVYLADS